MRLLFLFFIVTVQQVFAQDIPNSKVFLEKFKPHIGKYYVGEIVAGGREGDDFTGKKLVMQVLSYTDREVKVPFYVGDDRSRTWILSYSNNVIQLKHDHRHEDGSPDKITFYGGSSPNEGAKDIQIFPADRETCQLIDYACQNVWWMTIDEKSFTYNLRRIGSDRLFSVKFDLIKPVVLDYKPW